MLFCFSKLVQVRDIDHLRIRDLIKELVLNKSGMNQLRSDNCNTTNHFTSKTDPEWASLIIPSKFPLLVAIFAFFVIEAENMNVKEIVNFILILRFILLINFRWNFKSSLFDRWICIWLSIYDKDPKQINQNHY